MLHVFNPVKHQSEPISLQPGLCEMNTPALRSLYETDVYSYNNGIWFLKMSAAVILVQDGSQRRNNPIRPWVKLLPPSTWEQKFTVAFGYRRLARLFCRRVPDGKSFQLYVGYPTFKLKVLLSGTRQQDGNCENYAVGRHHLSLFYNWCVSDVSGFIVFTWHCFSCAFVICY